MPSLLMFRNVSLFESQSFGISRVNLDILQGKKYHFIADNDEKLNTLLGLLENRFNPDSGVLYRKDRLFVQSDRLILGDKIYEQHAAKWLALNDEFFFFGSKRRSKTYFIDALQAKHIRYLPIFKLKGEDRLKFVLLSLTFQETGLLLISKLLITPMADIYMDYLERLVHDTHCTLCLFSTALNPPSQHTELLEHPNLQKIDLRSIN